MPIATTFRATLVLVVLLASTGGPPTAAQQSAPLPASQSFTASATAILVDVVVRDRAGRPVTTLSAGDFEVSEDRVVQKIESFTRVSRGGGIGVGVAWRDRDKTVLVSPTESIEAVAAATPADESTTALVFDHLSSEALRLAQKATLEYVPPSGDSTVKVGVFATDPGIRVLEGYTTDRAKVRRAVERVLPGGTSAEEQSVARHDDLVERRRALRGHNETATAAAAGSTGASLSRNGTEIGQRETELRLIQAELNMLRSFDNLDRSQRGQEAIAGLVAVIGSLAVLPGRKTVVFFSEGLPAAPGLSARLDYVIDVANRANVTTYAVDARGLRSRSASTGSRKELNTFADERWHQLANGTDRTEQPLTMGFERVEDTLRLDSRTGLARLAEDTGGFLVEEANDLSAAFRRIDEDNQSHYLLTYAPSDTRFDGRFRTINVKVRVPGLRVFARKGYRAMRTSRTADTGDIEASALALLDRAPLPNAFPIHAAAFSFPDQARPGLAPLLVRVQTSGLGFAVDRQRSSYSGQASIVVRVRDQLGHTLHTVSQQYLLTGDAKDVTAARSGEILFYRELELPPGVHAIESIVFDAVAQHASARVVTLTIPPARSSGLEMSSLVLVNRIEEVSDPPRADPRTAPPLYVGRTLLYPSLGEPLRTTPTTELPFYFTLYGSTDAVRADAQLSRNGRSMAEAPVELQRASGPHIQHVGRLPIGGLPPGTYELRIRVSDGRQELSRTAFFTVVK